jgi:hypothetical protein
MEQILELVVVFLRCISHRWIGGQLDRAWTRNVAPIGLDLC